MAAREALVIVAGAEGACPLSEPNPASALPNWACVETANMTDEAKSLQEEVRKAVREALSEGTVRLDVRDLITQLNDPKIHSLLRHHLMYNYRFVVMLDERARRAARSTFDFIEREMHHATFAVEQFDMIAQRKALVHEGHILDLGVYKGGSTRKLAALWSERHIYGFDSFEGLPEDWSHAAKGTFGDIKGQLPPMPHNVTLVPGWFDKTLPIWAKEHEGETIALLRVDCDLYSSTKTIFDALGDKLRPGSWICFDELIGYFGWEHHEHKAFMEFIAATGFDYEYVAYGLTYTLARLKDRR